MPLDSATFAAALAASVPDWRSRRYCVALSGGLDSTVLLDLMAEAAPAALRAFHVDHGLQAGSAGWRDWCARRCAALAVPFSAVAVDASPPPGASPEAAARAARYGAFETILDADEILLSAHHADDQAETVLLQLLRGGGPAGLAGMPGLARLGRGWLCRPLLTFDRAALADYAARRGLDWLEDPSNGDTDLDRNYLRQRVLPVLRDRWPGLATTLGRSARHCAAAAGAVAERAAGDVAACRDGDALRLDRLRGLPAGRQREALRHWIRALGASVPGTRQLERLREDLVGVAAGTGGGMDWRGAGVRRFRDRLYLLDARALERLGQPLATGPWPLPEPLPLGAGLGTLVAEPAAGEGLAAGVAGGPGLEVRRRVGGEKIRPVPGGPRRRLKSLLREAGILPWMRDRVPLVFAGDELVAVADLWLADECRAAAGEAGWRIRWRHRPPLR